MINQPSDGRGELPVLCVGAHRRGEAKLLLRDVPSSPWEALRERWAFDHLASSMDRLRVYSCPGNMLRLTTLEGYLGEPATKRQRMAPNSGSSALCPEQAARPMKHPTSLADSRLGGWLAVVIGLTLWLAVVIGQPNLHCGSTPQPVSAGCLTLPSLQS